MCPRMLVDIVLNGLEANVSHLWILLKAFLPPLLPKEQTLPPMASNGRITGGKAAAASGGKDVVSGLRALLGQPREAKALVDALGQDLWVMRTVIQAADMIMWPSQVKGGRGGSGGCSLFSVLWAMNQSTRGTPSRVCCDCVMLFSESDSARGALQEGCLPRPASGGLRSSRPWMTVWGRCPRPWE